MELAPNDPHTSEALWESPNFLFVPRAAELQKQVTGNCAGTEVYYVTSPFNGRSFLWNFNFRNCNFTLKLYPTLQKTLIYEHNIL